MINQHGLDRYIPEDVKRAVRQRCRFGCVVCGSMPYHYDHFDPAFSDAKEHRPESITLLCGRCHDLVTRGIWSRTKITVANANPYCLHEHPNVLVDFTEPPLLLLGPAYLLGRGPLLSIHGTEILRMDIVEGEGAYLTARFFDAQGQETISIQQNELTVCNSSWDVRLEGTLLSVHDGERATAEIRFHPPCGVHIRRLAMSYQGWHLDLQSTGHLVIRRPDGTAAVDFTNDTVVVSGGEWQLTHENSVAFTGGFYLNPAFSGKRFFSLAEDGKFSQLFKEIYEIPEARESLQTKI